MDDKEKIVNNGALIPAEPVVPDLSSAIETPIDYSRTSATASAALIYDLFRAGKEPETIPDYKKKITRSAVYDIFDLEDGGLEIIRTKGGVSMRLQAKNFALLANSNDATLKKIFKLVLMEALEQAIVDGVLVKDEIYFPLQRLLDLNIVTTLRGAEGAFLKAAPILRTLYFQIKASANTSSAGFPKLKKASLKGIAGIIDSAVLLNNAMCRVKLSDELDWNVFAYSTANFPNWGFVLKNRPFDLLDRIVFIARQRCREIAEKGYFEIKNRSVADAMRLPFEVKIVNGVKVKNRKPDEQIVKPYQIAVEEIREAQANYYRGKKRDITLEMVFPPSNKIEDFLEKGKLRVYLHGEYAESFSELAKKRAAKIKARATIKTEAEIRYQVKKLEKKTKKRTKK